MTMKKYLSSLALLVACATVAGVARADTSFTFAAATDGSYGCSTYCVGFTTDTADTVDYVNVQYYSSSLGWRVTLSVNGVVYQGYSAGSGQQFTALSDAGGNALASVDWTSHSTK